MFTFCVGQDCSCTAQQCWLTLRTQMVCYVLRAFWIFCFLLSWSFTCTLRTRTLSVRWLNGPRPLQGHVVNSVEFKDHRGHSLAKVVIGRHPITIQLYGHRFPWLLECHTLKGRWSEFVKVMRCTPICGQHDRQLREQSNWIMLCLGLGSTGSEDYSAEVLGRERLFHVRYVAEKRRCCVM